MPCVFIVSLLVCLLVCVLSIVCLLVCFIECDGSVFTFVCLFAWSLVRLFEDCCFWVSFSLFVCLCSFVYLSECCSRACFVYAFV